MARSGALRAEVTSQVAGALGGMLLLGATLVPWSTRGAGSSIALRRVADLILSGTVDSWVPRWAGLVVYAIPLGGALLLLGSGLGSRAGLVLDGIGVAAAVAGTGLAVAALGRLSQSGPSAGTVAALAGVVLGVLALGAGLRDRRRSTLPAPHR